MFTITNSQTTIFTIMSTLHMQTIIVALIFMTRLHQLHQLCSNALAVIFQFFTGFPTFPYGFVAPRGVWSHWISSPTPG